MTKDFPVRPWRTVPEILEACAGYRPDVPLLANADGDVVSAAGLLERTRRAAGRLAALGTDREHPVVVDAASLPWHEVAVAYLAIAWLGAVAVLTTGPETERIAVRRLGVRLVVAADGVPRDGARSVRPAELASAPPLAGPHRARPDDRLDLVFTSGTTGEPKPIGSTQAQWTSAVRPELMASRTRRTVCHTGVPVGVSGGLHGVLLNHLARGVTSVFARDVGELARICRSRPVRELHLTPYAGRALARLLTTGVVDAGWADQIVVIRVVGGPVGPAQSAQLSRCFPRARVVSLYGLTEGGAAVVVKVLDHTAHDSIGRPAVGTEVRVLDPQGQEVPVGEVGELAVRSAGTATMAYHHDDELNEVWFPGGWARTGDLGFVDPQGEVRLVGRAKELLFLRGGRIGPEAVEEILGRHVPDGVEYAVAGLPGPGGGFDRIAVFLAGDPAATDIMAARERLSGLKGPFRPQVVRVLPEIPRSSFGKPLRRLLVRAAQEPEAD